MKRKILYLMLCCCLVGVLASADTSISTPPTICEVSCTAAYASCTAACPSGSHQIPCLSDCSFAHETCQNNCLFVL
jgi:hypothetical protein